MTGKKEKKKKIRLWSKKNRLLLGILTVLNDIHQRLVDLRNKEEKEYPSLDITKFEFTQIESGKDLFSFKIEGKNGLKADGQMSFWNCMSIIESLRTWKPKAMKEEGSKENGSQ